MFPALDQRPGADPSWAETMDSLRAPPPRDQKFWEWRRTSPILPVVFEDPGVVTEEVVQMHLEQRVVQRLLSRFYGGQQALLPARSFCHAATWSCGIS